MIEKITPVKGAAEYLAVSEGDKFAVAMYTSRHPDHGSIIQTCRTYESASKAAARWQRKENALVIKYPDGKN